MSDPFGKWIEFEISISELEDVGLSDGITDIWISISEEGFRVVLLVVREAIREFGCEVFTKGRIVKDGIGGFIHSRSSPDVKVLNSIEVCGNGTSIASGDWEEASAVESFVVHLDESVLEVVSIDVISAAIWNSEDTATTVVIEEDEDIIILIGLESNTSRGITSKNFVPVFSSDSFSIVIDVLAAWVNIGVVKFTEDLALEWVGGAIDNIIIAHHNDTVVWITTGLEDLILIVRVSSMAVVVKLVGSCEDHSPVLASS